MAEDDDKKGNDILTEMYSILSQIRQVQQDVSETGTTGQAGDNTLQEWVFGSESGKSFFKATSDGTTITVGYGEIAEEEVGVATYSGGTFSVGSGYIIGKYEYATQIITVEASLTEADLTNVDFFEFTICAVSLSSGGSVIADYYGLGRQTIGGGGGGADEYGFLVSVDSGGATCSCRGGTLSINGEAPIIVDALTGESLGTSFDLYVTKNISDEYEAEIITTGTASLGAGEMTLLLGEVSGDGLTIVQYQVGSITVMPPPEVSVPLAGGYNYVLQQKVDEADDSVNNYWTSGFPDIPTESDTGMVLQLSDFSTTNQLFEWNWLKAGPTSTPPIP